MNESKDIIKINNNDYFIFSKIIGMFYTANRNCNSYKEINNQIDKKTVLSKIRSAL